MASISTNGKTGLRRIMFLDRQGKRQAIRIGSATVKQAKTILLHVEDLLASQRSGNRIDMATAEWVSGLPDTVHRRLERVGLVSPRLGRNIPTMTAWVRKYIDARTDVKPNTASNFEQAFKSVSKSPIGAKRIDAVTAADADAFRIYLKAIGLGEGTIRRRCKRVRQFLAAACKAELIEKNPFAALKCGTYADSTRFYFVSQAEAQAVLEACPDAEWRLIFALARYGGLRCPSEILALTWGDIDWSRDRFMVRSAKTEHHDGGARIAPIYAELRPYLQDAFDRAEPGQVHAVTRYRLDNQNLRTQLQRIIATAGLKPWPKLFQNLRATRETELAQVFPLHVVCRWMGNTATVAAKHYLNVTEKDFDRATQKAAQKAAHFPAQQASASTSSNSQPSADVTEKHADSPAFAEVCEKETAPCEKQGAVTSTPDGTRTRVSRMRT